MHQNLHQNCPQHSQKVRVTTKKPNTLYMHQFSYHYATKNHFGIFIEHVVSEKQSVLNIGYKVPNPFTLHSNPNNNNKKTFK